MSKPKVAYILGAGASFFSLPVVKVFKPRMIKQLDQLNDMLPRILEKAKGDTDKIGAVERYLSDLNTLHDALPEYDTERVYSIDNHMRELYLNPPGRRSYEKTKAVLSAFLAIEELDNGIDSRYMPFLSSLFVNQKLSDDVVLLSWNYDSQLSGAAMKVKGNHWELQSIMAELGMKTLHSMEQNPGDFSVLFLNGIAGHYARGEDHPLIPHHNTKDEEREQWLLNLLMRSTWDGAGWSERQHKMTPLMSYAWEASLNGSYWQSIREKFEKVEELIVIGYSCPQVNRSIDQRLVAMMPNLKQVVIQSPNAGGLIGTFRRVYLDGRSDVTVHALTATGEFELPSYGLGAK